MIKKSIGRQSLQAWLNDATKQLAGVGIVSARLDAEVLLAHVMEHDRTWLVAHNDEIIDPALLETLSSFLDRRAKREPLAYITGHKEFYGRDFIVTPAVLIPRPETEDSIEAIKKYGKAASPLLDVGTGSGAIAITTACELPKLQATACDVSKEALEVAEQNNHLTGGHVDFVHSDLLQNIPGQFDIIVANLPYVDAIWDRSAETEFEPALAIFAEDGGLALINELITQVPSHLNMRGYLILEADPCQHAAIKTTGAKNSLQSIETSGYSLTLQKS